MNVQHKSAWVRRLAPSIRPAKAKYKANDHIRKVEREDELQNKRLGAVSKEIPEGLLSILRDSSIVVENDLH